MALTKRGQWRYATSHADVRVELARYGRGNGYVPTQFADPQCACGSDRFRLDLDDTNGVAVRRCASCGDQHVMGDGADYLAETSPEECECPCGERDFQITVGLSLYEDSEDVRWLYVGCRCPACGLTATYGDWKNEFNGYRELLARV